MPLRRSYIHQITEITKNSRKLDGDIEQILKDTRELQLESNSIQERLQRSYAILDEIVFRYSRLRSCPTGDSIYVMVNTYFFSLIHKMSSLSPVKLQGS